MTRLVGAALPCLVVAGGCLLGEVTGIPCTDDDECATAHFCDLDVGSCRAELDGVSAPRLDLAGVAVGGGAPGNDVGVPRGQTTALELVLFNGGGLTAIDVALELDAPACLALLVDEGTLPDGVVPAGSARVAVSASPSATCASPATVDWTLFFSGRETAGSFTLTLD